VFSWSQEASDNLKKVAQDAVESARQSPGKWVDPLEPHLESRVRYAQTSTQVEQFLVEAGIDAEEVGYTVSLYNEFYQVYRPLSGTLVSDPAALGTADTLWDSWYHEIRAFINQTERDEIILLIKGMGGLETEKIRKIKSEHCFTEPSSLAGYEQFVSADRRFPVSVSYPQELSFFYDFNREEFLHVDWEGGRRGLLNISRQNLALAAQHGKKAEKLVLQGKMDISQFMQEDFARNQANAIMLGMHRDRQKIRIEDGLVGERERPFAAKRLIWQTSSGGYGGEWVFFMRARRGGIWSTSTTKLDPATILPELWIVQNSLVGEEAFTRFLSTFRWLSTDFFQTLPAQP
jgi:hypothetical protein